MSWRTVPLHMVASLESGFGFPREYQGDENQEFPFFRVSDMNIAGNEVLMENHSNTVSAAILKELGTKAFPAGTVIFPKIGAAIATEKKRILTKPATYDNNVMGAVPMAGTNPKFLYYWFLQLKLSDHANPGHVPSIRKSVMEEIPFPVVAPSEQFRIVELLDEADRLRRLRREADAKAARILPALFLKMFGDPATNPMGWPVETLTKICSPKQWPTISSKELTNSGFPVYGANGTIGFYSSYNHEQPTVLITCRGATCGTINVCEPKSYVTGNAMALDEPDLGKTSLEFLECYLKVRGLNDTITGAAQPQITRQNLQVVTVFVPPPGLVAEFSRHVRAIKDLLTGVQSGGDRLEDAFSLLLQRAFSGQLTANWREGHMQELLAEMSHQARALSLTMPKELEALP